MAKRGEKSPIEQIFREEREEASSRMVDALLRLESGSGSLEEETKEILRVAHGLKGAAFAAGFPTAARFLHDIETCVGRLRDGRAAVDSQSVQALYDAIDAIAPIVAAESGEARTVDPIVSASYEAMRSAFGDALELALPELTFDETVDAHDGHGDSGATVRIPVRKLDRVLETAGELIASRLVSSTRSRTSEGIVTNADELHRRLSELTGALRGLEKDVKGDAAIRLRRMMEDCVNQAQWLATETTTFDDALRVDRQAADGSLDRMHDEVRALRLVPVGTAFGSFARLVRDVATSVDKHVELFVEGAETEIDRDLLETVREAIAHLLRNAVVHGVESPADRKRAGKPDRGRIVLTASTFGREAHIDVRDDGRGIDAAAVSAHAVAMGLVAEEDAARLDSRAAMELLFAPGFSTAEEVGHVAGRGVGLDAVRSTANRLGGRVSVRSELGRGTKFSLDLPVSRAAVDLLLVRAGDETFAIPVSNVDRIVRIGKDQVAVGDSGPSFQIDGRPIRVFSLASIVGGKSTPLDEALRPAIVLRHGDATFAIVVEEIVDHRQRLTKALSEILGSLPLVQGVTVLSDGTVVPIVDIGGIAVAAIEGSASFAIASAAKIESARRRVLVVDDSITTRTLQKGILEAAGYEVIVATNGVEALEKLARGSIDLVLSDVEMPKMDGIELAGRIKANEKLKAIPVVIVSSLGKPEDRERGARAGADAYIAKGEFQQDALLSTLRRLI